MKTAIATAVLALVLLPASPASAGREAATPAPFVSALAEDSPQVRRVVSAAAIRAQVTEQRITVEAAYMSDLPVVTLGCFPLPPGMSAPAVQRPAAVVVVRVDGVVMNGRRVVREWQMEYRGGRFCQEQRSVDTLTPAPNPRISPAPWGHGRDFTRTLPTIPSPGRPQMELQPLPAPRLDGMRIPSFRQVIPLLR